MTDKVSGAILNEDGSMKTGKIGEAVVGAYKKVENAFVNTFMAKEGESVEDAKARISADQQARQEQMKADAEKRAVDQQAMIEAVNSKNIFLALDVFEKEPLEEDSPLRENDRVLMTPHRANNSIEFEQRWQCLAEEINDFYNGKSPASLLTPVRSRVMSDS